MVHKVASGTAMGQFEISPFIGQSPLPHLPSSAGYSPQTALVAAGVHFCGAKNEGHVICDQIPLHAIGRGVSALQAS